MNSTKSLPNEGRTGRDVGSGTWFASLFKRKPKPEPKEPEKPEWWPEWTAIKAAYPVGRKFDYLGRTMIVSRLRYYNSGFSAFGCGIYIPPTWPAVITEYADERGEIHEHAFERQSWPILANVKDEPTAPAAHADRRYSEQP